MAQKTAVGADLQAKWDVKMNMVLEMSAEQAAKLDDLARKIGGDKTDFVEHALELMTVAVEAKEQGKRIGILDHDGRLETEITGL